MRLLAISLGNSSVRAGLFLRGRLGKCLRIPNSLLSRKHSVIEELAPLLARQPDRIVLCSVVPKQTGITCRLLKQTTGIEPELLTPLSAHGLDIRYRDPKRLGADRLAAAMGARVLFPRRNLLVVDFGTATTVTALNSKNALLGGAILPGAGLWAKALSQGTAQLPEISVAKPSSPIGASPEEAITSGIFFGHVGATSHLCKIIAKKAFGKSPFTLLATGGLAPAFKAEMRFTREEPNLILLGLRQYAELSSHAKTLPSGKDSPGNRHLRRP